MPNLKKLKKISRITAMNDKEKVEKIEELTRLKKAGLGFVQIFWGNGRGKTTASLGTSLRACGNGFKVHLIQFLKNGVGDPEIDFPGEIKSLERFPNFTYRRFGTGGWVVGKPTEAQIREVKKAFDYLKSCFEKEYDIIVADEIVGVVHAKILPLTKALKLISDKPLYISFAYLYYNVKGQQGAASEFSRRFDAL